MSPGSDVHGEDVGVCRRCEGHVEVLSPSRLVHHVYTHNETQLTIYIHLLSIKSPSHRYSYSNSTNQYIHTYIHISYHSFTPSPTYLSIHLSHLPFPSHPIPQKPQNSAQKPDGEGTARSISAETIVGTQRSIHGRGNEQSRAERNRTDRRDRNKQTQA